MEFAPLLLQSPLFHNITFQELESLLQCLDAGIKHYSKDSFIFWAGNPARRVGLLLEGSIQIVRNDVFGNRTILAKLSAGDLFGEVFACAGMDTLPVSAVAATSCRVLLLDYRRIITTCSSTCVFHNLLIENMLRILANKNLLLNQKIEVLSARGLREKLLTYLHSMALQSADQRFAIPFNRQELADYLSVDRGALSRELSAMQRDGLIRCEKNQFELL